MLITCCIWSGSCLFLIAQGFLLTFRYLRRAFIKFLRFYVPHILWCDADPTVESLARNQVGSFLLATFPFDINNVQINHSPHFSALDIEPAISLTLLVPLQISRVLSEKSFPFLSKSSKTLPFYFSSTFSFFHIYFSSTLLAFFSFSLVSIALLWTWVDLLT